MNILIIGQGIAGSCLAWELKRRGAEFTVADRPIAETASRVAAGLVNPAWDVFAIRILMEIGRAHV